MDSEQPSVTDIEYGNRRRSSKREQFLQQMAAAIYDSYAMRRFMRLDFAAEQVPDATTLLHFRHLLKAAQAR